MVRARTGGIIAGSLLVVGACQGTPAPVVEKKVEVEKQVEPVKPVKPETKVEVEKKVEPEKPVEPPPVVDVAKPAGPAAEQFMFVFRGDVALAPNAEEGWGTGKVKFKKTKEGLEGRRDVDVAKLPEALRKLDGAAVTLYGARGKVCEGTLKGLSLYGLSERGDEEETEGELPSMRR